MLVHEPHIDGCTQQRPLGLDLLQSADGPTAKPHALFAPSKNLLDDAAALVQFNTQRFILMFGPLPHQRVMIRMDLNRSACLAGAALPTYRTVQVVLTSVDTHRIGIDLVALFEPFKS